MIVYFQFYFAFYVTIFNYIQLSYLERKKHWLNNDTKFTFEMFLSIYTICIYYIKGFATAMTKWQNDEQQEDE